MNETELANEIVHIIKERYENVPASFENYAVEYTFENKVLTLTAFEVVNGEVITKIMKLGFKLTSVISTSDNSMGFIENSVIVKFEYTGDGGEK